MSLKVTNNAASRLKTAITETSTTLTVESGAGSLFPVISSGDYFYVTLVGDSVMEIVKVTAKDGDTFTITRAQDNTTAHSFEAGDVVELRINAACINDISSGVANKLDKSGGTMAGNLALNNAFCNKPNGAVSFGVGSTWNDAPSISLYGPNATSGNPNAFVVRSGQASYSLVGTEDGLLQWGGKNILTSAGGTMSGSVILHDDNNSLFVRRDTDDGMVVLRGGTDGTSAQIVMCGKNNPDNPGRVSLQARNGSALNALNMDPDGTTTLKGNPILTSAGGTISNITFNTTSNGVITRSVDNAITHIIGGTDSGSGYISLYGKNHASYPSECRFSAGSTNLRVLKDGTGYLNGYRILEGSGVHVASTAVTSGQNIKLPAGGTWKYFSMLISSSGLAYNVKAGSASGGSTLYSYNMNDAGSTFYVIALRTA